MDRDDKQWRSMLAIPYAYQVVETFRTNLNDDEPMTEITPTQPGAAWVESARLHEQLINNQRRKDHFSEKYDQFLLQGLIRGFTAAKISWAYERATCCSWQYPPAGPFGTSQGEPQEVEQEVTTKCQPTWTTVDVMDFAWDPAATSLDDAQYVCFRTWDTIGQLKLMQERGVYRNVDQLQDRQLQMTPDSDRDVKGRVEVWEVWTRDRVTTIANQSVVLRDDPNPFWHAELPFVVASPSRGFGKLGGKGICELMRDIQKTLWDLQNQRIDNARLINNARLFYDESRVRDSDAFQQYFPGAQIATNGPPQGVVWSEQPNTSIIGPAVQAEEIIKRDMQDVTGMVGYVSGAAQETVDQRTATGISIVQNWAQKRLKGVKASFGWALVRADFLWVKLNQQLLTAPGVIAVTGDEDAAQDWLSYSPQQLQGEFSFVMKDLEESLNMEQKRTEASVKLQTFAGLAAIPGVAQMVNWGALLRDYTEAMGDDPDKYLNPAPMGLGGAAMGPQIPGPAGPLGAAPALAPTTPPGAGSAPLPMPSNPAQPSPIMGVA